VASRKGVAVIRKRTRRAVKAAFSISLGVALLLGVLAAGTLSASAAQPTVKLGTKNFTEEFILGQLYKQALQAKGFKVEYHESIGSTEVIDKALTSGQINVYPEYLGTLLSVVFHKTSVPKSPSAALAQAKAADAKRGMALFTPTPFFDTDQMGVTNALAKQYGLKTISDMKKVPGLSICGFPEFQTRYAGLVGLKQAYGIKNAKFVPLAGISVYEELDTNKCKVGDVFSTDPQLASPSKYTVLADPKEIFSERSQTVVPEVSAKLASALGPKFHRTMDAVSAKLTLPAIIAMNKAVAIDKKSPQAVASAFLKANHLK
jgi:osmoprotectant transport system substrate-binding protein